MPWEGSRGGREHGSQSHQPSAKAPQPYDRRRDSRIPVFQVSWSLVIYVAVQYRLLYIQYTFTVYIYSIHSQYTYTDYHIPSIKLYRFIMWSGQSSDSQLPTPDSSFPRLQVFSLPHFGILQSSSSHPRVIIIVIVIVIVSASIGERGSRLSG